MRKLNTQEFIEKSRQIHHNKYTYTKTVYKNSRDKVIITCPIHGDFEQLPASHLQGHGCPLCSGLKKLTLEEFITRAKQVHNDKYDYSKAEYTGNHNKVCIICPEHGEFWQIAESHLNGRECPKCGNIKKGLNKRLTTKEFVKKASKVHNNKYDYSKAIYTKSCDKVTIICPVHGKFQQTANSHLQGSGCPKCNKGFIQKSFISKGEKLITSLLQHLDIKFIPQLEVPIPTSINKSGKAYVDFYLPDKNIIIEYNGEQHYIPKDIFGGRITFNKQVLRDKYIRKYCQDKKIQLIEISYKTPIEEIKTVIESLC